MNKGYTLLFAVLITSVVLSISVSVLNISRKEVILSGAARDSFSSVYMADGAIECAIAYDIKLGKPVNTTSLNCGYGISSVSQDLQAGQVQKFTFHMSPAQQIQNIESGDYSYPCAVVTVTRYPEGHPNYGTVIEARGYNAGWNPVSQSCSAVHPKKVERAFRYYYKKS